MVKVLFVCLGNICRSPMAKYVFRDMVEKENMQDYFFIDSAATSSEEEGNGMHYGTRRKLDEMNIKYDNHIARKMTKADYEKFDLIIGMEDSNIRNIGRIIENDYNGKVFKLLDFSKNPRDIADPWYTGNFDKTYNDVVEGCIGLLSYIKNNSDKFTIE